MSLRYTLGRFLFKFHKNRMDDDVIVHISISIEPTNFIFGSNTQQQNVHLMIKMKVTLTDDEGDKRSQKIN